MNEAYLSSLFAQLGERPVDVHVVRTTPPPNLGLANDVLGGEPERGEQWRRERRALGKARAKAAKEGANPGQHRYYAYVRTATNAPRSACSTTSAGRRPRLFPHRFNVKKGTKPGAVWVGELDKPWTCEAFVREPFEDEDVMSVHLARRSRRQRPPALAFVSCAGASRKGATPPPPASCARTKTLRWGRGASTRRLAVPREERVQLQLVHRV